MLFMSHVRIEYLLKAGNSGTIRVALEFFHYSKRHICGTHSSLWREWLMTLSWVQFSAQLCPTLFDPMNRSTHWCKPNSRSLLKLMPIESVMPSSHLIPCHPLLFLPPIPPNIRVFSKSQLFSLGGQSTGVSASASVLPMNTQDWSPSGWTGWISLQSKGLSRVFSNTIQKHQFFSTQLSSQSNSHIHTWPLEKP